MPKNDGYESVITQSIGKPAIESNVTGVCGNRLYLANCVAASGQVELIGLVRELSDAFKINGPKGLDFSAHLQRIQIIFVSGELRFKRSTLNVAGIKCGSPKVLIGERDGFKVSAVLDGRGVACNIVAWFGHSDDGELGGHKRAFGWVVVKEDEAIDSEIEFLRNGANVFVFVVPVRLEAGDVLELENGAGVAKSGPGDVLVVLRANGKQHATVTKRQTVLLEGGIRFPNRSFSADLNLINAVVANDASPKSVVEVEDENLSALAIKCLDERVQRASKFQVGFRCEQKFIIEIAVPVEPPPDTKPRGNAVDILKQDARTACDLLGEGDVELQQETAQTSGRRSIHVAEHRIGRHFKVVLNDLAAKVGFERIPYLTVAGKFRFDVVGQFCLGAI